MADIPAQLFVQLYSKLSAALSVSGIVGQDPSSILSLQIPGLYIRPHLDINDPATEYYVANALNSTLACSWTVSPKAGTVSDVYKSILDGKETPLVKLTPEQLKELDEAYNYLFQSGGEPTEAYRDYSDYQLAYLRALDNYEAAAATHQNGGPPIPHELAKKVEVAKNEWRKLGHQLEVDRAIATIAKYESYEPLMFWARLKERYAQYTRVAWVNNEFQFVTSNPPYELWFQEFGWSDFRFDEKDFDNQDRSGGVGIGDGTLCCCEETRPLIPIPSGALFYSDELGEKPIEAEYSDFLLTCRLRRIEIIRPWMDTNVFYSRAWRWSPASVSYGVRVSTGGDIAGRIVPTGAMPVLPTTALLARDVEIYWNDNGLTVNEIANHLGKGHAMRFGPFRLSRARIGDEHHISAPDPQLIGFISTILPKCPNPDPTLPWPLTTSKLEEWP